MPSPGNRAPRLSSGLRRVVQAYAASGRSRREVRTSRRPRLVEGARGGCVRADTTARRTSPGGAFPRASLRTEGMFVSSTRAPEAEDVPERATARRAPPSRPGLGCPLLAPLRLTPAVRRARGGQRWGQGVKPPGRRPPRTLLHLRLSESRQFRWTGPPGSGNGAGEPYGSPNRLEWIASRRASR
jgi:hypothetical protein